MMATRDGTWAYRDRFGEEFGRTYFRRFGPGVVSSVGIGTYLGEPTETVDSRYEAAIESALERGSNVVDTAINYRCQRSERVVGAALRESEADRDAVLIATKGGFVPFDGTRPDDPGAYVREEFIDSGLIDPPDLARGSHCIAPGFIDEMLERSLENLDLETIDLYYVHNPETQLLNRPREAVYDQLEATFERLEERVAAGDIGRYGVATWDAFRVDSDDEQYLSLPAVLERAQAAAATVGTDSHGLAAIQLPFNVHMADAFTRQNQPGPDGPRSMLAAARDLGVAVFASASIGQGELASGLPTEIGAELAGDSPAQRAINFTRSAPGVTCALVGASDTAHVEENVAAGTFDPLGARAFDAVFD
jgi:aryl-alcohol dehydrogenase-like predicted oxidoreductase